MDAKPHTIYKVCSRELWRAAEESGVFQGAEIDLTDGFIHFSDANQVVETVAKHFVARDDLVIVAVDASTLGEDLKWEKSRGGDLFPHLYGTLPISAVLRVDELPLGTDGRHLFPPLADGV